MTVQPIILRHAHAADTPALRDLAALDSTAPLAGPVVVAEVDGELQAAISLSDGAVAADPFRRTAHLVDLLESHAAAQAAARRRERQISRRRRPRLAFGL